MDAALRALIVQHVEAALAGGTPVVVATVVSAGDWPAGTLAAGEKLLARRLDVPSREGRGVPSGGPNEFVLRVGGEGSLGDSRASLAVLAAADEMLSTLPRVTMQTLYLGPEGDAATRRSMAQPGDAEVMVQLFEAPAHLVIVGGGHVGLAVATVGEFAGFSVTVIDDRPEFANRERFPMAETVIAADAGEALDALDLGTNSYVVLVSRGHRQDEEALRHAVGRGAAYVGMIGSRRRTSTVLRHLAEEGFDAEALAAVSTPIGLDIGAETPEEIAVSILGEPIMFRRGGPGGRMKARPSTAEPE